MSAYLERRIEILEEKLENIVSVGIVTQINGGSVRVSINGESSHDMPVLFPKTQDDKFQMMPDIGEQVVCLFLPYGLEQGFVIGSIYSDVDTAPIEGSDKAHIKFKDGAFLEYDRATHKLSIDLSAAAGEVDIKCKNAKVDCQEKIEVKAATEVNITSPIVKMNEGTGVVTGECACMLTGVPHSDVSTTVFAGKQ